MSKNQVYFDESARQVYSEVYGGGGSSITTVKAGQKIRIDLSNYTGQIYENDVMDFHNNPMNVFVCCLVPELSIGPIIDSNYIHFYENDKGNYMVAMIINTAHTQLLCECGYADENNNYTSLMPATVVYESDTPIGYDQGHIPPEVLASLPTIEMSVTEDLVGNVLYPIDWDNVPFELVD